MQEKVEFRPIELEICKGACTVRQVIEIDVRTTLSQMIDVARQLLHDCGWQKVRVGVGSIWSNWITNNQKQDL